MVMRKNLRNLKPSLFITVSLLIFLIPLGYYFLIWVPERKDQLSQRYLRLVAMMSDQFENRGVSMQTVLNPPKNSQEPNQKEQDPNKRTDKATNNVDKYVYCESKNQFEFTNQDIVYTTKHEGKILDFNTPKISDFFYFVYLSNEFDDILLVRHDGEIIYRKSGVAAKGIDSSLHIAKIKSLQEREQPEKKDKSPMIVHPNFMGDSLTQIIELEIAKNRYLLFLQPIPLEFVDKKRNVVNTEIDDKKEDKKFPWYMGGLLAKKEFQRRSHKISGNVLWFFSLLLFLFLISLPVFKLMIMSPRDRIKVWDMIFVGISLLIGIPLILYLFTFGASGLLNDSVLDQELEVLSNKIHDSFLDEINDVRYQLKMMLTDKNLEDIHGSIFKNKNEIKYHFLDMIFLMDKEGDQKYKGVPEDDISGLKLLNVSDREYFKRIKDKEYWFTECKHPIMLQTVYSKSSGVYELNLSMPREDDFIAGISFRPLSVLNPVLPYGFGFAIINRSGKVIFHSDPKLNNWENFFSECDKSESLRSTIWGRTEHKYKAYYQGKKRTLHVRPIQNIPWTLIVFRDIDISATYNLDTVILASILFWLYVLCLIILVCVCLLGCLIQKKILPSPSQVWHRKFRWLWPDARLNYEYSRIAVFNIILFVILLIYSYFYPSLWLFLIPILIICFDYILIQKALCKFGASPSANLDSLHGRSFSKIKNYAAFIITVVFSIVLIVFLKSGIEYEFPSVVIFSVFILSLISLSIAIKYKPDKIRESKNYKRSFSFALYSLILLFVVYPALSSFRMVSLQAELQCLKIKQVNLARSYVEWDRWYRQKYKIYPGLCKEKMNMYSKAKDYGVYSQNIIFDCQNDIEELIPRSSSLPPKLCDAICDLIPPHAEYTERLFHLHLESDSNFTWKHYKKEESEREKEKTILRLNYNDIPDVIYDESGKTKSLIIESDFPKPDWGNRKNLLILAISIIVGLSYLSIVLFPFVSFIRKVIFPHRKIHGFSEKNVILDKNILSPGKYIILGNSKDLTKWKESFRWSERCQLIDCAGPDLNRKFTKDENWIILENFDYRHEKIEKNLRKIELLEDMNARGAGNVILLSQYEPLAYFHIDDKNDSSQKKTEEENQNAEKVEERFKLLMDSFKKRYVIDEELEEEKEEEKESTVHDNLSMNLKNLLDIECGDSIYLKSIRNRIYDEFNKKHLSLEISEDDLEEVIFEYACPVYDSIWRASSNDEKYCMICLAFDGMVNQKNDNVLQWLLRRKLIKLTPLNLLNKTFRRFVRVSSDINEILGWQSKQIESMWTKLKRPAMFLLFGLILFFAITQPNLIRTWLLIIPVLSGAIPALLRMIEQMSKGSPGSSS